MNNTPPNNAVSLRDFLSASTKFAASAAVSAGASSSARTLQSRSAVPVAATPSVKVVTLPPLVITRTS